MVQKPISKSEIFRLDEARVFRRKHRGRFWAAQLAESRGTGCAESNRGLHESLPLPGPACVKGEERCMSGQNRMELISSGRRLARKVSYRDVANRRSQ